MPDTCSAVGCFNRRQLKSETGPGKGLHFYRLPTGNSLRKVEKRRLWLQAICREKMPDHARVCSAHFISGRASDNPKDPDYVPSLFSYTGNADAPSEKCCVPNCHNDSRYNLNNNCLSFYPFPKNQKMRTRWIDKIVEKFGQAISVTKNTRMCSRHFRKTDIISSGDGWRRVKCRVVPSKFQLSKKVSKTPASWRLGCARDFKVLAKDLPKEPVKTEQEAEETASDDEVEAGLPTDVVNQLRHAKDTIHDLETQSKMLLSKLFFLERFSNDSESIEFYTGFADYATFKAVFLAFEPTGRNNITRWWEVQSFCRQSMCSVGKDLGSSSLQLIDEFFMFMCFLRQGLCEQDLAVRFNVPKTSVTYILLTWINYLFVSLRKFQIWPSPKSIVDNMPACFKSTYPNIRVILDCSEVVVEIPGSVSYGHQNPDTKVTFKGLLGISPFGAVTFVSDLYVANISNCQIMEYSRVLNLMVEPCTILAAESFAIQNPSHLHRSTVVVPPFWSSFWGACDETYEMAELRFHIERALGHVKDYHVFQSVIPKSLAESANKMWMVCALLANFKRSPFTRP